MKQFLVLLVFTLGKECRVRHRELCVVVIGIDIAGVKVNCNNLQGRVKWHCLGTLDVFADNVCDFLQSVTTDLILL